MSVDITAITPQRIRGSAQVRIDGTGFGTATNNDVLVGGSSASIVAESTTQIDFTLPFIYAIGIIRDVHVLCQEVNLTTGESAFFWLRIKADVNEVADWVLESAIPGPLELLRSGGDDRPRYFEAKDMERLASLVEAWTKDVAAGQVLSFDGTGIDEPGGTPAAGSVLLVDLAEATDLRWALAQSAMLPFGGSVPAAPTLLVADGDQTAVAATGETEGWAPAAGTIDLGSLLVKSAGPTLDRVRILVNGAPAYDSGAGLGFGNNGVWAVNPAVVVAKGDRVELEATALGGAVTVVGGLRIALA